MEQTLHAGSKWCWSATCGSEDLVSVANRSNSEHDLEMLIGLMCLKYRLLNTDETFHMDYVRGKHKAPSVSFPEFSMTRRLFSLIIY